MLTENKYGSISTINKKIIDKAIYNIQRNNTEGNSELLIKNNLDQVSSFVVLSEAIQQLEDKSESTDWLAIVKIILVIISLIFFLSRL